MVRTQPATSRYCIPEASVELVRHLTAYDTRDSRAQEARGRACDRGCRNGIYRNRLWTVHPGARDAVVAAHPRGASFKTNIIDAFYEGMKHRPDSTFVTVNDDVVTYKDAR